MLFFFFRVTATTVIYTLSLHDALPISSALRRAIRFGPCRIFARLKTWISMPSLRRNAARTSRTRSEEHTSELQSQSNLVCRLLLEKKKKNTAPPGSNHFQHHRARDRDR